MLFSLDCSTNATRYPEHKKDQDRNQYPLNLLFRMIHIIGFAWLPVAPLYCDNGGVYSIVRIAVFDPFFTVESDLD